MAATDACVCDGATGRGVLNRVRNKPDCHILPRNKVRPLRYPSRQEEFMNAVLLGTALDFEVNNLNPKPVLDFSEPYRSARW